MAELWPQEMKRLKVVPGRSTGAAFCGSGVLPRWPGRAPRRSPQLLFSGAPCGRAEGCERGPVRGAGHPGVTLTQASRVEGLLPACGVSPPWAPTSSHASVAGVLVAVHPRDRGLGHASRISREGAGQSEKTATPHPSPPGLLGACRLPPCHAPPGRATLSLPCFQRGERLRFADLRCDQPYTV